MSEAGNVTLMLRRWHEGDPRALDSLLPTVYAELRAIAARRLADQRGYQTLQPTALLNEMFLRLLGAEQLDIVDRQHFFRLAARIMRQILVNRLQRSLSEKHGGDWQREDLTKVLQLPLPEGVDVEAIDAAVSALEKYDKRLAQIVELRYFVGLSVPQVASVMEVDERTIYRHWAFARSWLRKYLEAE